MQLSMSGSVCLVKGCAGHAVGCIYLNYLFANYFDTVGTSIVDSTAYLKVSLSKTQTAESRVAATVAERGVVYSNETSPKQSPGPFRFTLMFTPCLLSRTWMESSSVKSLHCLQYHASFAENKGLMAVILMLCHGWREVQCRSTTSNCPLLTTYSSEAARPLSPSLISISPARTLLSYISVTVFRLTTGSSLSKSSSLPKQACRKGHPRSCARFSNYCAITECMIGYVSCAAPRFGAIRQAQTLLYSVEAVMVLAFWFLLQFLATSQ